MKATIILLAALALCAQAQAQNRVLTTTDGQTYTGINSQRVEPDGLYIEYTLPGGGLGMSKVKFTRLSRAQQQQFGFDREKALDYEAAVAQANRDLAQKLIERSQIEQDAKRRRDAENERAYPARMREIAALNAALADAFYRTTRAGGNSTSSANNLSYGADFSSGHTSTQTTYGATTPDLFPSRGTTTKSH